MQKPMIQVSIIDSTESRSQHKDILEKIAARSKKYSKSSIEWLKNDGSPILQVSYPTLEDLEQVYEAKTKLVEKTIDVFQSNREAFQKLISQAFETGAEQDPVKSEKPYLTLKYSLNYKEILLKYYSYSNPLGHFLGSQFFIEEIDDGFLLFYNRKEDFIVHQLDLLHSKELPNWFKARHVNLEKKEWKIAQLLQKFPSLCPLNV
ncbi:MAG: hypothetical protein ACTSRK_08820 [Promethearchaeota archaeon]